MSHRLPSGGRLIDRAQPLDFTFNGRRLKGYAGDTLASAILGSGHTLMGRSFKYHRARGVVTSGPEEPNALVNLGEGGRLEPNQRATNIELFEGVTARSQNHWPSLEWDVGAVNGLLSRFLPAGFYYKMFMHPRSFWKHVYEPFIRQSAGLGKAPEARDADTYEHFHIHVDVLVIGGGIAGLTAARAAGEAGRSVLLIEQSPHWGGRAPVDGAVIAGVPAGTWVEEQLAALRTLDTVHLRLRTTGAGVYDHGYVLAAERLTDHDPEAGGPRHRLWKIRARHVVTATGAIERPLSFAGNDIPGVMLASAVRDYVVNHAVAPGDRTVIVTNNDDAYRTALALHEAGLTVPVILDARSKGGGNSLKRRAKSASGSRTGWASPRSRAAPSSKASRSAPSPAAARGSRTSPATRSPCRAAGPRSSTSGPTAAASFSGTRRRPTSAPTPRARPQARTANPSSPPRAPPRAP
jgi:sarcosine oxidase, subunit alpha